MRGHSPDWHGFAMQDTRALPSTGFRRRCAAWRVTFLCVAKEKSPKERPPRLFALLRRVPSVHPFVLRHAPMGFDLHHPWRRSKSAADILVLAPNRAERCSSNSGLAPGPAAWTNGLTSASNRGQHQTHSTEAKLPHLCNKPHRNDCIGEKITVSTAASGTHPYREMALY